ncbi:large-conductance mechanosensitive channel protein MscL [Flavobacteriaceae bacterium]|jgi:large conductance mechanosensitive channel|nr:large-conductance mechanosensitive channel protein MscL [Flavobacteriaceae bacterium]MDA9003365.1 large-conductance mechanosensitive channel protein MscL [Flavobacteriaceae bacterium]
MLHLIKTPFNEFKKFINRGNVIDMAVGLVMATYFGAIAKSLINDVIMPPVGMLLGGVDFSALKIVIQESQGNVEEVAIHYGAFINTILTFLMISFAIFIAVRLYNKMQESLLNIEDTAPEKKPIPTKQELLLTEIRDLLKK